MLPVVGYRSPLWPRYHTIWFTEKSKNTEVKIYFNLKTYMLISAIFQNIYSSSSSSSSIFQLLFILLVLLRHPVRDLVHVRAHSLIKICSVERDLLLKACLNPQINFNRKIKFVTSWHSHLRVVSDTHKLCDRCNTLSWAMTENSGSMVICTSA